MSLITQAATDLKNVIDTVQGFVSKEETKLEPIIKNFVKNSIPAAEQIYTDVVAIMGTLKSGDPLITEAMALIQVAEAFVASLKAL